MKDLKCEFEMHICTDGRKYVPLEDCEKLRKAVRVTVNAIESGEKMPDRCGNPEYRQEFGWAFVEMLKRVLGDEV